ncbi:hypothetical protein BKP56_05150 [Marinilactibacillus sp. 15R]|uniref:PTS mannose/fructose/sorbose/N-acetylgalactosamine transporter subunit IIC n=1 Tax=Marinilactibacillus sp. 15R TaxID=1911586 RepID=UPI00090BF347|nr:PTS sugar transporter subunit IIC [Marinilactibacillus sp. 15R]API88711.1 hypothetical protein BKP56_05150 [Marinilactibacillus sp. 15R]
MYEAFVVGFVLALAKWLDWWMNTQLSRPIFIVALLGLLLGQPTEGIMMGAAIELVYLGTISLGGVMPQDFTAGAVFGGAFALVYGQDASVAITLSIPIGMLGSVYYTFFKGGVTFVAEKFETYTKEHNLRTFKRLWKIQYAVFLLSYFVIGFVAFLLGADAIDSLVNMIPEVIINGLEVAAGMLPALGMALLLKTIWDKSTAAFFFIGFALVTFFGGDLISVAFVAVAVAVFIALNDIKSQSQAAVATTNTDEVEDFFND